MRRIRLYGLVVLAFVAATGQAQGQTETPAEGQAQEANRFGVGFQSSWPAYGISGLYDVSDEITVQAVVGAFGTLTTLSGRGMYRFQRREKHSLYGYGTLGVWRHSFRGIRTSENETSPGLGGGAGVELDWRRIVDDSEDSSFPPLYSSFDLGFVLASFDSYNFSGFVVGAGLHYRF